MEDGYNNSNIRNSYPYRVMKGDMRFGMRLTLGILKEDIETVCKGYFNGFKVFLHSPDELPKMTQKHIQAPLNQQAFILVNPTVMRTSKDLLSYSPYMYVDLSINFEQTICSYC